MDGADQIRLRMDATACAHIDAYIEYRRTVGDDDRHCPGGIMAPHEYERYKKEVVAKRVENRLFVSWSNQDGMDCKLIGPETPCFCGHRYRSHQTDFKELPETRPIRLKCRQHGCSCASFTYVPIVTGLQPVRCSCKHLTSEHKAAEPHACLRSDVCSCRAFRTSYRCGCGQLAAEHSMIVETRQERIARGHPVGKPVPYAAMGGLTGFSSLIDGYLRLDDSGVGTPPLEWLEQSGRPLRELPANHSLSSAAARRQIAPVRGRPMLTASKQPLQKKTEVKSSTSTTGRVMARR